MVSDSQNTGMVEDEEMDKDLDDDDIGFKFVLFVTDVLFRSKLIVKQ